jgi:hypothetical protein
MGLKVVRVVKGTVAFLPISSLLIFSGAKDSRCQFPVTKKDRRFRSMVSEKCLLLPPDQNSRLAANVKILRVMFLLIKLMQKLQLRNTK